MPNLKPLTDDERALLDEYRATHPKELPWQFSIRWLLLLTTCVALLAALVARTNMAVGFLLLLAFGTAVLARRLGRQRKRAMREIDEQIQSESESQKTLYEQLSLSHDPRIRNLLTGITEERTGDHLISGWLGTVAAGTLYPPVMATLAILFDGQPLSILGSATCAAAGGFLLTSFLAALLMVAVALMLMLSGFRPGGFAVGSLVGGGTGLVACGILYSELAQETRAYFVATAIAILLGQTLAVCSVRKMSNQKTQRIFKPKVVDQQRHFRLRQLFMLTTIVAVLSALVSQLGLSEAQVTVCLVGSGWLGGTILVERLLLANSRST